jgi:Zn-dependent alcohol dehydrogenase
MTLSVEGGSTFTEMFDDGVQVNGITGATGTVNVTIKNSTFSNAAVFGTGGISLNPFGDVNLFATVDSNAFDTIMRPVSNLGSIGMTNGLTADADVTIQRGSLEGLHNEGVEASGDCGVSVVGCVLVDERRSRRCVAHASH